MAKLLLLVLIPSIITGLVAAFENCEQGDCKRASRTRREAPSSSCTDGAKTPQQASDILKSHEGAFVQNAYDDNTMVNKSKFLTAARGLLRGVCRNMTVGGAPVTASSSLAHLRVQRTACNDTATSFSDVPCLGCKEQEVGKYRVMEDFLAKNSQWNCSQNSNDTTCDGACIGSVRMPNDMMSNFSTKCLSQVIHVQMFNPATNQPVSHSTQGQPVLAVQIEFDKGSSKYQSSNFKCAVWKDDVKRWNTTLCNLALVTRNKGHELADCNCTRYGSVCVVPADAFPSGSESGGSSNSSSNGSNATTVSPTTAAQNQNATTSSGGSNDGSNATTTSPTTGQNQDATTSNGGSNDGSNATTTSPTTAAQNQDATTPSGGSNDGSNATTVSPTTAQNQATTTSNGGSSGESGNDGSFFVSLSFPGDCKTIINTSKEEEFLSNIKTEIQDRLSIKKNQIINEKLRCGSLIVSFTIIYLNSTTLAVTMKSVGSLTSSKDFTITLSDGTKWVPSKSAVGLSAGNVTWFVPLPPTTPPTTHKRYELEFDYRPIMFTVALGLLTVVLCVCCTCIIHSWWLRKNKFTKYNSMTATEYEKKMKAKEDKDRMREVEEVPMTVIGTSSKVAPSTSNFDMSNETMPKINERSFTNYDWAHTSYLPGMMAPPDQVDDVDEPPRLMLDDDSNSSDGEENEGYVSDENPTSSNFPRAVSHLSLAKDGSMKPLETSDTMSNIAPPIYDNVTADHTKEENTETAHIYDNADDVGPNNPRQPNPARPPTEPLYSTVE